MSFTEASCTATSTARHRGVLAGTLLLALLVSCQRPPTVRMYHPPYLEPSEEGIVVENGVRVYGEGRAYSADYWKLQGGRGFIPRRLALPPGVHTLRVATNVNLARIYGKGPTLHSRDVNRVECDLTFDVVAGRTVEISSRTEETGYMDCPDSYGRTKRCMSHKVVIEATSQRDEVLGSCTGF